MTEGTSDTVADALGVRAERQLAFTTISTDTRSIGENALFVALQGDRFDGHDFLAEAQKRGAAGAVVRRGTPAVPGLECYEVDDPLAAYGLLARSRRRAIPGPVVVVTGTNGKTTTKEMIAGILRTTWRVHATKSNLNNLVGVPMTILEAPDETQALVIEAGTNQRGEIARIREITEPYVGVVTNVAPAHLEGLGDIRGVLCEKVSLLQGVQLAVVGTTPPELATEARQVARQTIVTGLEVFADFSPDNWSVDSEGRVTLNFRGHEVPLPVVGRHQAANAMIALAVGITIGVDVRQAVDALVEVEIPGGRCELIEVGTLRILNDTYNANPASLLASLDAVRDIRYERPVVVAVGSMLEMGRDSERAHREMAQAILDEEPYLVGATGEFVAAFAKLGVYPGERLVTGDDAEALGRALRERLSGNEFVLLKASRGVRLERAIPFLTREA
jgi:UDP-N-acetylmuramoyl-tripeptide--D-alanyl-D-alanine ligase